MNTQIQNRLIVSGLTALTTIDYPGKLSAVVFLQGCPWSCGYCHNTELIPSKVTNSLSWNNILSFLQKRINLLDAVVFSGGEPTLQTGLARAMQEVKAMGFKIGLHSAGIYPDRLARLLPLIDWIGLDIKAAKADYPSITKCKKSGERAWKSAQIVIESGVKYEFRTTVHPDLLDTQKIMQLEKELRALGAKKYMLQPCIIQHCLDKKLQIIQKNDNIKNTIKVAERSCRYL